jgi:hypothetical protein
VQDTLHHVAASLHTNLHGKVTLRAGKNAGAATVECLCLLQLLSHVLSPTW